MIFLWSGYLALAGALLLAVAEHVLEPVVPLQAKVHMGPYRSSTCPDPTRFPAQAPNNFTGRVTSPDPMAPFQIAFIASLFFGDLFQACHHHLPVRLGLLSWLLLKDCCPA
jgi:hypothetical protein